MLLESTLSLKARGLYALLCCWPDDQKLSMSAVMRRVPDGRWAVQSAWKELVRAGLLTHVPKRGYALSDDFGSAKNLT
jgi:hypothetical protein